MLVFFANLGLMEFQVRYLGLFLLFSVVGGLNISCKTRNHPQPAKPPINQPDYPSTSQTTLKLAKYQTNHLLISQKLHCYYPEDIFYELQHFPCPSHAKREIETFFYVPARFRISPSPLLSSLPSLIADYNPNHELLTQLRTLTNFVRRLGLMMLH